MNPGARGVPEGTGVRGVPEGRAEPVKLLYIGGFGRSGSTLVERILGQIPGFCSAGEVVFIWQRGLVENQLCGCGAAFSECDFWTRVGKTAFGGWDQLDGAEMVALQHQIDRNRYIPAMVAPRLRPGAAAALDRYTDALSHLYRGIREVSGARVVIDASKHASTAYLLRRVTGLDLRVVHLVRDARGVAYSWTKEVKKPEVPEEMGAAGYMPVYRPSSSGLQWLAYNLLFDAFGVIDDTMVLRYEEALADPRRTVERILAHAGEHRAGDDFSFLHDGWVDLGVDHTVAGNPMRFHQGRLDLRLDEAWRQKLPERDRKVVSALTFPLQARYGYQIRPTKSAGGWGRGPQPHRDEPQGEEPSTRKGIQVSSSLPVPSPTHLPKVSVVIATRERPVLLRRAVQRVMEQSYPGPIELVIVFDQSEPQPIEVEVPPGRELRIITNHRSPGLAGARNSGVLATTGELVAFCDDDDEWLPEKLARQVAALATAAKSDEPSAELATSGIFVCYEDRQTPRVSPSDRITLSDLLRSRVMEAHPSTVIVTRSAFDRIGFVDEHIPGSYAEDYEWLLRAARVTGILAVREPLVNVHWHQSSWFSDRWKMIVDALTYLLEKVPEFEGDKAGLARIYGQIALAHAASGERRLARTWARRTIALQWKERRAYVALLISARLVKVETVQRLAHAAGKGL